MPKKAQKQEEKLTESSQPLESGDSAVQTKRKKNKKEVVEAEKKVVHTVPPPVKNELPPVSKTVPKKGKKNVEDTSLTVPSETLVPSTAEPETLPSVSTVQDTAVKKRQVPTRDSVMAEFKNLIESIDEEIVKLRETTAKSKGVKFLRTINKRIRILQKHALRISKQQRKTVKRNNVNSGFRKPVQISNELTKFTGWEQGVMRSRVDVTKFICDYIKKNNLQNPEDRRQIRVEEDANLKKLLKYDGKDKQPLTYYTLQTYLKHHFLPTEKK